jgi:hypothetical protein
VPDHGGERRGPRRACLTLALLAAAGLGTACQAGDTELECVERFRWGGLTYDAVRGTLPTAGRLGTTSTLTCDDEPFRRVAVFRAAEAHPTAALVVRSTRGRPFVAIGPGYLVESPEHPAHLLAYGSDQRPDAYRGKRCGRPATLLARTTQAPRHPGETLVVRAASPRGRRYLQSRRPRALLVDVTSEFQGLHRHGLPYIRAGELLRLRLRRCGPPGVPAGDRPSWIVVSATRARRS